MFVTNTCGTGDRDISEDEILSVVREFNEEDGGDVGDVGVAINDKVVVLMFNHYHCEDADCVWIIVRSECSDEFITNLEAK